MLVVVPVRENKATKPCVGRYGTEGFNHNFFGPVMGLGPIEFFLSLIEICSIFESVLFPESLARYPPEADLAVRTVSDPGNGHGGEEAWDGEH